MSYILGISCFYHDSAVTLLKNGKIVFAAQEERFTRIKHDANFPDQALRHALMSENIDLEEVKSIVFYDKPFLKFERLLETYLATVPFGFNSFKIAMPIWLREKLFLKNLILKKIKKFDKKINGNKIFFTEHHFSHAASAFYPSPFKKALILVIDGVGEWATTSISIGNENKIKILEEMHFPHSLGLLYSAFTYYLGFKVNSGEYKVMGLAPYGKPIYSNLIFEKLIDLKEDGSFNLNQYYFSYSNGLKMTNSKFNNLFGRPERNPKKDKLEQFHMDLAASLQNVLEIIILKITEYIYKKYKIDKLCLAGGVALNCVANSKIIEQGYFKKIWIQPAAGDAGGSLGAAYSKWYHEDNNTRHVKNIDAMAGSYLGNEYSNNQISEDLLNAGAIFEKYDYDMLITKTAKLISEGKAIGWFQGKMEFGPRALGGRSIIADPRSETMQKNLNLKIKYRESFRPFAPSVLIGDLQKYFEISEESPYMLLVAKIKENLKINNEVDNLFGIDLLNIKRSILPAITHVDYSARIQTVDKINNKKYFDLINAFKEITGIGVLVNTSFNIRGEPIVSSPLDAFNCFMGTDLDYLVIGDYILDKQKQSKLKDFNYKSLFNLD